MKKVLGGVALAAVMACGWAGVASASVVRVDISGTVSSGYLYYFPRPIGSPFRNIDLSGNAFDATITFDTDKVLGGVSYFDGRFRLSIGSLYSDNILSQTLTLQDGVQAYIGEEYQPIQVPPDSFISKYLEFVFNDDRIFQLGYHTGQVEEPVTSQAHYEYLKSLPTRDFVQVSAKFHVDEFSITAVPLPASAPLLGSAVLVLGAVGFGMRRRAS